MEKDKKLKALSPVLLVLAAVIWGVSFISQSEGGEIGSFTFQAIRCTMAYLSIGTVVLITDNTKKARLTKKRYKGIRDWFRGNKQLVKCGIICGIALTFAANLQQFGIDLMGKETSSGKPAFLTALYIVIVPIFGIFSKKKLHPLSWLSVAVAVGGLYLISVKQGTAFGISFPDALLIACAVFFGIQIFAVDTMGKEIDGVKLSCIQFFIVATISAIGMILFEKPDMSAISANMVHLLYSGVMSGGVAYTLQILGQKRCQPVLASLLMSLESVFAALSDWMIRGNSLNARELTGCVVMFAAILLAQTPDFIKSKKTEADN
ncbi:MAG: DMT family transporter [Clostridia bacterium]|nr:DMT family transporter [Clostridia bacterium]